MTFRIESADQNRESFAEYKYRIYKGDQLVANYWHDYRGDDHGIDFVDGRSESWPVGGMTEFLEGGGPRPLALSARAVAYLKRKVGR